MKQPGKFESSGDNEKRDDDRYALVIYKRDAPLY